ERAARDALRGELHRRAEDPAGGRLQLHELLRRRVRAPRRGPPRAVLPGHRQLLTGLRYSAGMVRPGGAIAILAAALWGGAAEGDGGSPRVIDILFPPQYPGDVFAVTDVQGLFAGDGGDFRWLCEDAIQPNVGLNGLAPLGDGPDEWIASTRSGVYRTADGG